MGILVFIGVFVLLGLVVMFVGAPLKAARLGIAEGTASESDAGVFEVSDSGRQDLEVAREAKYREIRDAELDFRTGKLSAEDYAKIDGDLRAEALIILDGLEKLDVKAQPGGGPAAVPESGPNGSD